VVLTTYHNIGMLDFATLFWAWLKVSEIGRFFLLELDGLTCSAARALGCPIEFECATAADMMLPREYTQIRQAGALQEWGTSADSPYFKFLRWKLRFVELSLAEGVDVVMADVDVLVLSPSFIPEMAQMNHDLVISSDARSGIYSDNVHCPCSHPMYQRYSADWVCAGLFYMRSTPGALWFMREVQKLMDQFTITDQDAIQAVLTGHTQVAVPRVKGRGNATASAKALRTSGAWLKPLWLEGLAHHENLRNTRGIQPLNTPMKEAMWMRLKSKQTAKGFTWRALSLDKFGNGPMLVHHWDSHFSRPERTPDAQSRGFLSIHANCNTKALLANDSSGASFLFHPELPSRRAGEQVPL